MINLINTENAPSDGGSVLLLHVLQLANGVAQRALKLRTLVL